MSDWQLVHLAFVKVLFFKPFRLLHFFDGGNGYTHEMTLEWCLRAGIWLSYAYGFSSPVAGARTSYIVEYGCKYNNLDEVNHSQHVLSAPHIVSLVRSPSATSSHSPHHRAANCRVLGPQP